MANASASASASSYKILLEVAAKLFIADAEAAINKEIAQLAPSVPKEQKQTHLSLFLDAFAEGLKNRVPAGPVGTIHWSSAVDPLPASTDVLACCAALGCRRDLIKAIRACKTAAEERAVIAKECAILRDEFKDADTSNRPRGVAKPQTPSPKQAFSNATATATPLKESKKYKECKERFYEEPSVSLRQFGYSQSNPDQDRAIAIEQAIDQYGSRRVLNRLKWINHVCCGNEILEMDIKYAESRQGEPGRLSEGV